MAENNTADCDLIADGCHRALLASTGVSFLAPNESMASNSPRPHTAGRLDGVAGLITIQRLKNHDDASSTISTR
jgi:hypothetical protein